MATDSRLVSIGCLLHYVPLKETRFGGRIVQVQNTREYYVYIILDCTGERILDGSGEKEERRAKDTVISLRVCTVAHIQKILQPAVLHISAAINCTLPCSINCLLQELGGFVVCCVCLPFHFVFSSFESIGNWLYYSYVSLSPSSSLQAASHRLLNHHRHILRHCLALVFFNHSCL